MASQPYSLRGACDGSCLPEGPYEKLKSLKEFAAGGQTCKEHFQEPRHERGKFQRAPHGAPRTSFDSSRQ